MDARQCSTPEFIETPRATLIPAGIKSKFLHPQSGQTIELIETPPEFFVPSL